MREWAESGVEQIAIVAETPGDARDINIKGPSGILSVSPPWFRPDYYPSKRLLQWPGRDDWITRQGPQAHIYSGAKPSLLRGPEHGKAWVDELAKFQYPVATWSNLTLGLRSADSPQICLTTTPIPMPLLKTISKAPSTVISSGSTYDNSDNLTDIFYTEVIEPLEGTELAQQEIYAKLLDQAADALWKRAEIEAARIKAPDHLEGKIAALKAAGVTLEAIAVGVDPAAKKKETSSETGIIAAARDDRGEGYVLGDYSGKYTPSGWARRVAHAFEICDADVVVYESNQGGDMVAQTLHGEDDSLPLREVTASRGKQARAEPISLRAEKGQIHHVGFYVDLEDQLCTWVPEPGAPSPDRLDAFVWVFSHLLLKRRQLLRPAIPRMVRDEE